MISATTHPAPDILAAYNLGKLDRGRMKSVERHVLLCEQCCREIAATPRDPLIEFLRSRQGGWPEEPGGLDPGRTLLMFQGRAHAAAAGREGEIDPASRKPVRHDEEWRLADELTREGRYGGVRRCGVGGMSMIFRAVDRELGHSVALKVLRPHLLRREVVVERFRRGISALARLSHPNVVKTYGSITSGRLLVLVMELIEGPTLAEYVERRGRLGVRAACECVRQAALGLQHAFERGVIHRDVKPQNLMLTRRGRRRGDFDGAADDPTRAAREALVKLIDFDLMNFADEPPDRTSLTTAGASLGTPDYIAPEQIEDAHATDIRGDIYSLGCSLYFLLTGRPPFLTGTAAQKLRSHLVCEPRPVTDFRPDISPELNAVLRRMMAKDRDDRFHTPAEVALAMEALLAVSGR